MSTPETSDPPASNGQLDTQPIEFNDKLGKGQEVTLTGFDSAASAQNDPSAAQEHPHRSLQHSDMKEGLQDTQDEMHISADDSSNVNQDIPVAEPSTTEPHKSLTARLEGLSVSAHTSDHGSQTDTDAPPPPPEKDELYLSTKSQAAPPLQTSVNVTSEVVEKALPDVPASVKTEKKAESRVEGSRDDDSQPEIQSIIGQFQDTERTGGQEQLMSPRLELAEQFLGGQGHFPPRHSSLDHSKSKSAEAGPHALQLTAASQSSTHEQPPAPISKQVHRVSEEQTSTRRSSTSTVPPPPEPEPDQPFDFHRFLEQLRHRTADPVAKFLRSFLNEFGKRQWMVHEQVKIISDFLTFITNKMAVCEVWRDVSDSEFDNAKEGMEKLVMNRLYSQTFSPAIPAPPSIPRSTSRSRRREMERLHGPWRRGQHQEDVERDDVLAQKMRIYSWVKEDHLDIPPVGAHGRRFLNLAQQEILKINGYRAPRDKVICILNCCKVIFGLLKNSKRADTSADSFVPLLIYVVLQARPEHLVSNIQYILRFRNQDKLGGEAGYYLSSLSGAIQFIETLDRTSLTVSDEEFERNVEAAVSAIAEQNRVSETLEQKRIERPAAESSQGTPRASADGQRLTRRDAPQTSEEDTAPVAGLLRTIQKPLSTIGRMFSDEPDSPQDRPPQPVATPQPGAPPRLSPNVYQPPRSSSEGPRNAAQPQLAKVLDAQDAAARQASAEDAEARKIQRAEHNNVVETLSNMFPNLDRDIIDDVVKMKEGRVGLAVDACLALSAE
ncbi:guanine nucleotide exchange factor VPS9 [Aspergillus clavatus NRRL 1]|uniref:Guanine nucleotide exchange factor Vps9, putative n=1 Tax=Aspergillus clavatus (strain ATCC 1007 / CBS 513.65 / DSM 816 / NCTC 3887 / NRRL 1 / QM 1276 / 107) TaxID=344612 RepID=A1CIH0_ASPCL|nr:guanine nucleotide exchange factor Vps9, putative [Aspergillus clavatus NRRL 1]EAW10675.1 guanine nucleotide exchange factor Vps9, putative [Aspergillus clavatus NRRL 1]